jgi:FtsH-binding integral membrane protein
LHNRSTSTQVAVFSGVGAAVGLGMMLVGLNSNNKGLEKAGRYLLFALLIIFIIAIIFMVMYPQRDVD